MRVVGPLALLLIAAPAPILAGVEVRVEGDRVSVRADAAPLSEVLDQLGKRLGMKVVYEGPAPRTQVHAALESRTPAEAVLGVLEGLGLDFLARLDATGTRVDTLILTAASAGPAPSGGSRPSQPAVNRPQLAAADEEDEEEEIEEEQEEPQEVPPLRPRPGRIGQRGNGNGNGNPQRPGQGNGPNANRQQPAGKATAAPNSPTIPTPTYPVSPFAPQAPPVTPIPNQPESDNDDEE